MSSSLTPSLVVGVDIAAKTFTAAWTPTTKPVSFNQTTEGFQKLQDSLLAVVRKPHDVLVVMEATGSYWVSLAVALHEMGFDVSVVNPKVIHNYAKTLPRRSKTDTLDAQLIRQFGAERTPPRWTPPPAVYHELRQRLVARDALLEMYQQARNQRHALLQWPVLVQSVVDQFNAIEQDFLARLKVLDKEIATTLQLGDWATSAALLQTIPGIGVQTTAWLLVATLNFALCPSPEMAVGYVGLNPLQYESGTSVRGRPALGRGGHRRLRRALYQAAVTAARFNPPLKIFYERLRERGKPCKVARCAVARKLLHLAWAVTTKQQPFDLSYGRGGHEDSI